MVNQFRCAYCNKSYARESWFRKHDCEKRRRFEQIHNMDFIRALNLFIYWRKRGGWLKRGEDTNTKEFAQKFAKHFMYQSFVDLAKFATENWVITSIRYLTFCIDHRIADKKWTNEETLRAYREHIRRTDDPITQTRTTYDAIKLWCDKKEIDRREFFAKVSPGAALQMVADNKISPWVLFGYDRSREDLLNRVSADWLHSINEFINNTYWINKVEASEDIQRSIQSECERLFADE